MGKELTQKEIRNIQLSLLNDIHEFCIKYNLTYFLGYGTLLGAIRHKGFIPWDDDIDIIMPRNDFDAFVNIYQNNHNRVLCSKNCDNWPYFFAKLCDNKTIVNESINTDIKYGINIDIFPLEQMSESFMTKIYLKLIWILCLMFRLTLVNDTNGSKIKKFLMVCLQHNPVKAKDYVKLIEKITYKINLKAKNNTKTFVLGLDKRRKMPIYDSCLFKEKIDVNFENTKFFVPKEYDKILQLMYGNYMELPPENQRVNPHSLKVYTNEK